MACCVDAYIRSDEAIVSNGDLCFVEHGEVEIGKETLSYAYLLTIIATKINIKYKLEEFSRLLYKKRPMKFYGVDKRYRHCELPLFQNREIKLLSFFDNISTFEGVSFHMDIFAFGIYLNSVFL